MTGISTALPGSTGTATSVLELVSATWATRVSTVLHARLLTSDPKTRCVLTTWV